MGKIGVISDIHGNYQALLAVLRLLDEQGCDEIIHTGDVMCMGPQSLQCLQLLLSRKDVTLLLGNHDRDFALNVTQKHPLSHVPSVHAKQVFESVGKQYQSVVAQFPLYVTRQCGQTSVLFSHYPLVSPQAKITDEQIFSQFLPQPTAEGFDQNFCAWHGFDYCFFGHKHEPCDLVGKRHYVDVGSVGCHPDAVARAIVIEYDNQHFFYKRVQTPYDQQANYNLLVAMDYGQYLYDFYYLRKNI